jgi:hypothetical protein
MIGAGNPTAFVPFTFSSPSVVAGSVYAIVITTTNAPVSPPAYSVGVTITHFYVPGDAYSFDGTNWVLDVDLSLAFKTFVTPPAIPEYPLGLPLLAIFMIIAYGLIRRKTNTA